MYVCMDVCRISRDLHECNKEHASWNIWGKLQLIWGHKPLIRGVPMISPQVVAGDYAFVALNKAAGTIRCWGFGLYGGVGGRFRFRIYTVSPQAFFIVAHVRSADRLLCRNLGVITCATSAKGDCSAVTLTGITDVYTNGQAFLALNRNSGQGEPLAFPREEFGRVLALCGVSLLLLW